MEHIKKEVGTYKGMLLLNFFTYLPVDVGWNREACLQ